FGLPAMMPTGMHQSLPLAFKRAELPSKSLKELTGVLNGSIGSAPEALITADKILEAAGKTFKGTEGGFIKIEEAKKQPTGDYVIRLELQPPPNAVPAGGPGGIGVGGAIQLMPLPAVPVFPPGAFQAQAKPAPLPLPVQGPIQIQIGGA